jgi:hypothetical protein
MVTAQLRRLHNPRGLRACDPGACCTCQLQIQKKTFASTTMTSTIHKPGLPYAPCCGFAVALRSWSSGVILYFRLQAASPEAHRAADVDTRRRFNDAFYVRKLPLQRDLLVPCSMPRTWQRIPTAKLQIIGPKCHRSCLQSQNCSPGCEVLTVRAWHVISRARMQQTSSGVQPERIAT